MKEKKVEVIEETIVEEIAVNAEDTIENLEDTKENIKLVDTIVRPWENGVYGDMKIDEEKPQKVKKEKKIIFLDIMEVLK